MSKGMFRPQMIWYSAALIPLIISFYASQSILDVLVMSGYYLLLAASWNLLAGFAGQYSFAHVGLATAGAYITVVLEAYGVSAMAAVPIAAMLTALVGGVLGVISIRMQGIYLALVTLAFSGAFIVIVTSTHGLTGGSSGHSAQFIFEGHSLKQYVLVMLGVVTLYFVCQSLLLDSRLGLQIRATAEGETIAEGLGVRTARVKVAMFAYTAFWAGSAGSLLVGYIGLVSPSMGSFEDMGLIIAIAVIGGFGKAHGAIIGVIVVQIITYNVRGMGGEYTMLVFSSLLIAILYFARDGLSGIIEGMMAHLKPAKQRWLRG